jgi:SpoVK/Ycf46/Vps4 family AAA+-type ATPase
VLIEKEHVSGTLKQEEIMTLEVFRYISAKQRRKKKNAAAIQLEKELVGMESVKQQIQDIVNVMKVNQFRAKKGMPYSNYHNVHLMIGAPGTAKTTVAQILGNMMVEEKLLPGNRFICVNGAELKGMYVGHSAPKTKQIFEENDIIMIDEAYSLTASGNGGLDTFAQEVLAQLMIELEEHATDKLVLFAGYGGDGVSSINNKMLQFLNANPGLKSRINSTIYFPSYSAEDMVQIVHRQAENMGFTLDPHADKMIYEYFKERVRDVDFGNGREARSLIEACNTNITKRACKVSQSKWTKKSLQTIKVEDVMYAIGKKQNESHAQIGVVTRIGF